MTRGAAAAALLCALVASCGGIAGDGPQAVDQSPARQATAAPAPAAGTAAWLEDRLVAANAEIDRAFIQGHEDKPIVERVRLARAEWNDRLRRCTSETCRRAMLNDQLNRIAYAFGRNAVPMPDLPWESGELHISMGPDGGVVRILPIIDDRLLIWASTVQTPEGRWICEMLAEGRVTRGGDIEMTSLDDARLRFRLRREPGGRLSLTPVGKTWNRHCGAMGSLAGTYQFQVRRYGIGEAVGTVDLGASGHSRQG